jgi:hypothetical protein
MSDRAKEDLIDSVTRLLREVDGLCAFEISIRESIGNTNWEILRAQVAITRSALVIAAKPEPRRVR